MAIPCRGGKEVLSLPLLDRAMVAEQLHSRRLRQSLQVQGLTSYESPWHTAVHVHESLHEQELSPCKQATATAHLGNSAIVDEASLFLPLHEVISGVVSEAPAHGQPLIRRHGGANG